MQSNQQGRERDDDERLEKNRTGGHDLSDADPSDTVCGSDLAAISFSSATTGYVLLQSGQVLYTTNGGDGTYGGAPGYGRLTVK
jgi:hypothetical protein